MTRQELIHHVINKINQLPDEKIVEISDFAEFLLSKIEDNIISHGITLINTESKSFDFLKDEEDLYSVNDLKERYK